MKKLFKETEEIYIIFFIAAAVAFTSQFYFNAFSDGFRVSLAIIVLPLLIMTIGEDISAIKIGFFTSIAIFALRATLYYSATNSFDKIMELYVPNVVFYIAYGFIFEILLPNKYVVSYPKLLFTIFISDFLSNICEICVTSGDVMGDGITRVILTLAGVAVVRSFVTWVCLIIEKQYRTLLQRDEHEKRYQRLFLMTTGLKNEIFFMRKNSEEIEKVMATAYKLYENLSVTDLPPEIKKMSLELAKDVHEIKKDYFRIIKGIENEITDEYDEKEMKFSDLLYILQDTTYHLLKSRKLNIQLHFLYNDDFVTDKHYELMNILKNLVTNAAEAIDNGEKGDEISIRQYKKDDNFVFFVKDNGPGISKRHLPNIFKMGYSTKFDYTTGNIFRGVGLYGVKTTIEENFGGTIEVESVFGDGTQFVITIPQASLIPQQ